MANPEQLLAAGGFLSVQEKLKNESTVDRVSARSYRHPALGDRPVVRLTADNLAAGEDLTLDYLGFSAPEVTGPVAKRQRQALGFPGWALVNDPQHARFALALVKGFKSGVRKSKSKPGHGYDEFVETSKQLGKSVAHFLPSFWEQVGREFIALDNATYASRAFGKAREAEKVHALKVDESIRQDAFLEFALAGAVSIKALTEYGKELSSRHDPKSAWTFFRELCVRRILGGMPPWPSMFKDMQPLIKAAGLDQEQEAQAILAEIIDSPAISRAGMGFWGSVSKSIGNLAQTNAHLAGVLLNMIPQSSSWRNDDIWPWLDHLDAWGILPNAWQEGIAEEARPTGGPAGWLKRVFQSSSRPRQRIFDILTSMAPRLRKDQVPVDLYLKIRWRDHPSGDVDLLDLALELKIPLVDPPADLEFDLEEWATLDDDDRNARDRPRDPVSLAADPRFVPLVRTAVKQWAGDTDFERTATGKMAFQHLRRDWLASLIDALASGGLPRTEESLHEIENKAKLAIFREFPEELAKLREVDLLPAVCRSIQGGLLDEFGWPEFERVWDSFVAGGCAEPLMFGTFPYLIITDKLKVVVLKGSETVLQTELRLPKKHKLEHLMYVDGDLLVWADLSYQTVCFWNSDPKPGDPGYRYFSGEINGVALDYPGGGTFVGEKVVHRGDKTVFKLAPEDGVYSDGTHWWNTKREYDRTLDESVATVHEVDPVTGKRGRQSLPRFFEDFIQDGTKLDFRKSSLLPLGSVFPNSSLGCRDGLIGARVRSNSKGTFRIEGIDGRSLEISRRATFANLLSQPGSTRYLPVGPIQEDEFESGFQLWNPTGEYELSRHCGESGYHDGQAAILPAIYLHAFQQRDAAASKKLRAITNKTVKELMLAEQQDWEASRNEEAPPEKTKSKAKSKSKQVAPPAASSVQFPVLDASIHKLLGAKVDPRLLVGLRGLLIHAGEINRRLEKLVAQRSGESSGEDVSTALVAADNAAAPYLQALSYDFEVLPNRSFMATAVQLTRFFNGETSSVQLPEIWFDVVKEISEGSPQRLWSEYCEEPENKKWIPLAEAWSDLPFQNLSGWFRRYDADASDDDFMAAEYAAVNVEPAGRDDDDDDDDDWAWVVPYVGKSSRFLIRKNYGDFEVLEYSPDGQFESVPGLTESRNSESISPPTIWSSESLRTFVRQASANPLNVPSTDILNTVASAAKATPAEVALVWLGLPKFNDYGTNFMPTSLREACKLKAKECSAARESLKSMPSVALKSLVNSVLAGDPSELWENPPTKVAERIVAAWSGSQVDRIPLSPEWVQKVTDVVGYGIDNSKWLEALSTPEKSPLLSDQGTTVFKCDDDSIDLVCDQKSQFNEDVLEAAAVCIAMLAYGLPVGDPARQKIVGVYRATLKALNNPGLMLWAGSHYAFDAKKVAAYTRLVESNVGKMKKQGDFQIADEGALAVAFGSDEFKFAIRPAKITTSAQAARVSNLLTALLSNSDDDESDSTQRLIAQLRVMRSDDFAALVKRVEQSPVSDGSYETNPILSAPNVVQQVAKTHQMSEKGAAYYLQLLALPDPTDKNITLWNGWTTSELKKVASELTAKKLVLEATRSRAGRKVFLPGGWEDLKSPHLPLETWKLDLLQMSRDDSERATAPLERILPLEPVHSLFAKAWKRIVDGDVPQYEKVK